MKNLILAVAVAVLFGACEARVENPPADKSTTIVNPPGEKKEEHTTIVNPPAAKTEKTETTTTTTQ